MDGTAAANDTIARQLPSTSSPVIRLIELPPQSLAATATVTAPAFTPSSIATAVESSPSTATAAPPRLSAAANARPTSGACAPTAHRPDPRLGLVDRTQAEHEARAKAMWGDTKEQVVSYLMIQGFTISEATELATKLFKERAAAVRSNGIRKIIIGIGLMCVPVIALLIFLSIGVIPMKLFALTIMVGLYGFWLLLNGILMAVAPKSERGDVANQ
jgi:hypothetical protein